MSTNIKFLHADQIGGCVTLISTDTTKICIDFGENLPGSKYKEALEVEGLTSGEVQYDAVFFTHYHGDHIGRFNKILPGIPLYMSQICRYALLNIYHALAKHDARYKKQIEILEDKTRNHVLWPQQTVQVGDIKVTPYTIDHSAEAAMMFLIETPDKRILHMGDFRTHGFMGEKLKKLLLHYVLGLGLRSNPVDILITEGTNMTREEGELLTEDELLTQACALMREHKLVLCICSSTNFIRLRNFYRAVRAAHKVVLASRYMLEQVKSYYQYKLDLYSYLNDSKQDRQLRLPGMYSLLLDKEVLQDKLAYKLQEIKLRERGALIFLSGTQAAEKLQRLVAQYSDLQPLVIYSQWSGYIKDKKAEYYNAELAEACAACNTVQLHTSGHASKEVVEEIIRLVNPREYVAIIHSEQAEIRYRQY
ncbi:MBL fold metallo-hydrolase [Phascolarctobacterium succinatutens]|uniref:MBL fold metallo-hydrolase n=1 Tax=Phascolarctobacterium succinatutens TaxID=626940 RepID=UPI003078C53A